MRLGAVILVIIQLTSPVPLSGWDASFISDANAVLYSPDTKVPRTGELALRKAIPANTNMKSIQVHNSLNSSSLNHFHCFNISCVEFVICFLVE